MDECFDCSFANRVYFLLCKATGQEVSGVYDY